MARFTHPGSTTYGIQILDAHATYEDFIAAHPTGEPGDAHLVGDHLYAWNVELGEWIDAGHIVGPAGTDGTDGTNGTDALWYFEGTWVNGVDYAPGSVVEYQGSCYYHPTGQFSSYSPPGYGWELVSAKGADGADGADGAAGGFGYYGSFFDELDQTGTTNSIQAMRLRTTDFSNGVSTTGTNNTEIRMANAGKYNIAFSAQLHQTNSSSIVNIWLAKNGTAMAWTNTRVAITANNPYYVAAWNFFVDANANDYYEIMWTADSANAVIEAIEANTHPATPSLIVTVNQVG